MPSDAMLGTGPSRRLHAAATPLAIIAIARGRTILEQPDSAGSGAIKNADQALRLAESSGMEVSEARLSQDQARDALTKARVTIHSFQPALVDQDIQAGMKIAAANLKAGQDAMVERNHRRIGLGVCLIAIAFMLVGLWLYIKKLEG